MRHPVRLLVFIIWLASTTPSVAEIVRFKIEGTLDGILGLDPPPPNLPAVGSPFSGSFDFDTDAPNSGSTFFGTYHTPFPTGVVSLRVGDWEWKETGETPVTILVGNDVSPGPLPEFDSYFVGDSRIKLLMPELVPPRGEYWLFRWDLEGPPSIFMSTDLPEAAFNLQPWTTNQWSISLWGSPPAPLLELTGIVSSFESVVVPEPSGIFYGAVACFVMVGNWWRRKPSGSPWRPEQARTHREWRRRTPLD